MKTLVIVCTVVMLFAATASAGDLAISKASLGSMGLGTMQSLSDSDGMAVRGKGPFDSLVLPRDLGIPKNLVLPRDLGLPGNHTSPGDLGIPNDFVLPRDLGLPTSLVLPHDLGLPGGHGFGGNPWGP
jgi:hypothetical protein